MRSKFVGGSLSLLFIDFLEEKKSGLVNVWISNSSSSTSPRTHLDGKISYPWRQFVVRGDSWMHHIGREWMSECLPQMSQRAQIPAYLNLPFIFLSLSLEIPIWLISSIYQKSYTRTSENKSKMSLECVANEANNIYLQKSHSVDPGLAVSLGVGWLTYRKLEIHNISSLEFGFARWGSAKVR